MIVRDQQQTQVAWDRIATGYDTFITPTHLWLGEEGLRRAGLRPGMRVLDVAAGSGALSLPAARLGAEVLAVDLSPVMLERLAARAKQEGLQIETRVMDGQALELEDDTFDLAGSQFGVMLFPDMPRGIKELARVTKFGGRVLMHVYGWAREVDFLRFFVTAIQRVVPQFQGPFCEPPPLPLQLQDPARLRSELLNAGLRQVAVETITETLELQSGAELWTWLLNSNPIVGDLLAGLELSAVQMATVQAALEELIRERAAGRGAARLTNPINVGLGTK